MSRPIWFVKLVQRAFPTRFGIARWARRVPFIGKIVDHFLFRDDSVIFLPGDHLVARNGQTKEDALQVVREGVPQHAVPVGVPVGAPAGAADASQHSTIQIHEAIQPPEQVALPSSVVDHFIDQANHLWIMDKCFCREADDCEDYPIDIGCLFMGEAVHKINPKLGHLATRGEAHAHLARAREAGLVHMIGRNRIDTVWMGVGPAEKLLTVCNCCPCCCLWQVLPDLPPEISGNVHSMPGVTVTVTDACVGCGLCTRDICFVDAIQLEDGHAMISDACRGCGRCVDVCPQRAIHLTVDMDASVRLSIEHLAPLVDIE